MIKVVLTGNIGSGKSTVAKIFTSLNIPVFHADVEAKLLYKREDIKNSVQQLFGDHVFNSAGDVCFKTLAQVVFNHPESLKAINHIIHPLVLETYTNWLQQNNTYKYSIHEAAVVFENKLEQHFDYTISVSAPENIRLQRIIKRDGLTAEQFHARAEKQLPDEIKNGLSDFVIKNDGTQFLIPQVMKIHKYLITL